MVLDKVRIRFRKGGTLRLVSHHDLMRCFERMLRRAALHRVCYRIALSSPPRRQEVQKRIESLLADPHCWVERTRPRARRLDLRPYIRNLTLPPEFLEMDLCVTPSGTARPDEILHLLGLDDLRQAGAVLERTTLEILDERPGLDGAPPFTQHILEGNS